MYKVTPTKKNKNRRARVLKIEVDDNATDKEGIKRNVEHELGMFAKPMFTLWKRVGTPAERFMNLLVRAKEIGMDLVELVEPRQFNDTMFSFLYSGIRGQHLEMSNIFCGVYKAIALCKEYHRYMYMNEAFWEPLMNHGVILQLPDVQFFEGVMTYVATIAQISYADTCSGSPYQHPVVEEEYFFVTSYTKAPVVYEIFKRLLKLQEDGFSSRKTKLKVDYKRIVSGYFDPKVQEMFWSDTVNYPVDFLCIMLYCFIRLPPIQESAFMETSIMDVLMDVLDSDKCERMHTMLMFALENVVHNTKLMSLKLFGTIMKSMNFKIILSIATTRIQGKELLRRSAQKVILDTLSFRDECRAKEKTCYFPSRKVLTNVGVDLLKEFASDGNNADKGFISLLIAEIIKKEKMRDIMMEKNIPQLCVRNLRSLFFCDVTSEYNLRVMEGTLAVLMRLAHASKERQTVLLKEGVMHNASRYMFCTKDNISYNAKCTLLNMTGRLHDAQLELFKEVNFKTLISVSRKFHKKYTEGKEPKANYLKTMPVDLALIRQELSVNYYLTKGNGADNSYINMNEESTTQLMEILSYCITDHRKTLPGTFLLLSVACLNYVVIMETFNIKKWLTTDLLRLVVDTCSDKTNLTFLQDSGDFVKSLKTRYPDIWEKEIVGQNIATAESKACGKETFFGVKCSWPPCLNCAPTKEMNLSMVRTPLKKCSNCYKVAYCGVSCQKAHWKSHKKECKKPE